MTYPSHPVGLFILFVIQQRFDSGSGPGIHFSFLFLDSLHQDPKLITNYENTEVPHQYSLVFAPIPIPIRLSGPVMYATRLSEPQNIDKHLPIRKL